MAPPAAAYPQLPLGLALRDHASFENFIQGGNAQLCTELQAVARGLGEPFLYLWGAHGSGRSHLLHAICRGASEAGRSAFYLSLAEPDALDPGMLDGLHQLQLVCLDDLEGIAGDPHWEEALFVLFNQLREARVPLVAAALERADRIGLRLPDLVSRLGWGLTHHLQPLDDEGKLRLLTEGAERLGMTLTPEAARYVLNHAPREVEWLRGFLDRLDRTTLAAKRKPTVPFIRELLERDPLP